MKKIILTGGGTAGHVSVNLALIPRLLNEGFEIYYVGSKDGIERDLVSGLDLTYIPIQTGRLRRYLSFENIKDFFRVIGGIFQSIWKIRKIKADICFSKGGFVSVPAVIGSFFNGVPSLCHESDLTPGLANKLSQPFSKLVMTTFPETVKYIGKDKGYYVGPVIRDNLKGGDKNRARKLLNIGNDKPNLLIMGGSMGAQGLNDIIRENLDDLLLRYNIIHGVGKGNLREDLEREGYIQIEYIKDELKDILALADVCISRSGSNAIFEFLYYKIPMLLIPYPRESSRGDQIQNAKVFENNGYGKMILQEDLNTNNLLTTIDHLYDNRDEYINNMDEFVFNDALDLIYGKIVEYMKK